MGGQLRQRTSSVSRHLRSAAWTLRIRSPERLVPFGLSTQRTARECSESQRSETRRSLDLVDFRCSHWFVRISGGSEILSSDSLPADCPQAGARTSFGGNDLVRTCAQAAFKTGNQEIRHADPSGVPARTSGSGS